MPVQVEAKGEYQPSLTLAYGNDPIDAGPTKWEAWPVLLELPSGHRAAPRLSAARWRRADADAAGGGPSYYAGVYAGTFITGSRITRRSRRFGSIEQDVVHRRAARHPHCRGAGSRRRMPRDAGGHQHRADARRSARTDRGLLLRRSPDGREAPRRALHHRSGMLGPLRVGLVAGPPDLHGRVRAVERRESARRWRHGR